MKNNKKMWFAILVLGLMIISKAPTKAQDKQYKARLSVDYHHIMETGSFIEVSDKFRGEDGFEPATNLLLYVYQQMSGDSLVPVGEIMTDESGIARYQLKEATKGVIDSLNIHEYVVKIESNSKFADATKALSFEESYLQAEIIEIDSVYHIAANLVDAAGGPIPEERLKVMVQRLFAPLTIGKSYYKTDDEGGILVPFEDPLPGVDGILTFEVVLESNKYGNVRTSFDAPIGKLVVDESTFDQRTIWSPPFRTPVFLWVFANVLILGTWIVIFILGRNLYRIYRS
jgi:hypothetical protein